MNKNQQNIKLIHKRNNILKENNPESDVSENINSETAKNKLNAIYMWNIKPDETKTIPMVNINHNSKYFNPMIISNNEILPLVEIYPNLKDIWNKIPNWITKADLGRLLYIYYNGGFYFDVDCKINKEIIDNNKMVLFIESIVNIQNLGPRECKNPENCVRIANYAFGTTILNHPFLKEVIDECITRMKFIYSLNLKEISQNDILWVCGPDVITTIYHKSKNNYNNLLLLNQSYISHYCYGSWR